MDLLRYFRRPKQTKYTSEADADGPWGISDNYYDSVTRIGARARPPQLASPHILSYEELSELVDFYWLASRIVKALPEVALQGRIFAQDEINDEWEQINKIEGNDDGAFFTACVLARTHGASLLIKGSDVSGDPESPMPEGSVIHWLSPVSVNEFTIEPGDLKEDVNLAKYYGDPEYYRIVGQHKLSGARVHHSRVVHFSGPALVDQSHSRERLKLVQASALDAVSRVLQAYSLSWSAANTMLQQGAVPVWELKGLLSGLKMNVKDVQQRMLIQSEAASYYNAIMLEAGAGESFRREPLQIGGVADLLKMLALEIAAAGGLNAEELFGKMFGGLSENGEIADQKWIRRVNSYWTRSLAPRIKSILPQAKLIREDLADPGPAARLNLLDGFWKMGAVKDSEVRAEAIRLLGLQEIEDESVSRQESLSKDDQADADADNAKGASASER